MPVEVAGDSGDARGKDAPEAGVAGGERHREGLGATPAVTALGQPHRAVPPGSGVDARPGHHDRVRRRGQPLAQPAQRFFRDNGVPVDNPRFQVPKRADIGVVIPVIQRQGEVHRPGPVRRPPAGSPSTGAAGRPALTEGRLGVVPGVPDASETSGVPGDAAELRAENARLRESAERLRMLVEDKDAKIAELEERIAWLERLISRNSGNSSMSPSTDDLPGKKPPERRTRQGGMKRKPGKQPGAPGAFLAWNEHPDKTEDVFPEGICPCGADLADARDLGVKYSHQVTDLPEARAVTIQHDRHEMQCACGPGPYRGRPARGGGRARHGDLRAELPGLVRVPAGDAPRPGGAVRGHPGVDVRHRSRYAVRYGGDIDAGQLAWDPSPGRS